MTDYLGPVLHETALVGSLPTVGKCQPMEVGVLRSPATAVLSDWILYLATALFLAEVVVSWPH